MIESILDNDLYKFSMQNAVVKLFPRARASFAFINRKNRQFPKGFDKELRRWVQNLSTISLRDEEAEYFMDTNGSFIDTAYIDYLRGFRFDPSDVGIFQNGGDLEVNYEGYWHRKILWEVVLMASISEIYFKMTGEPIYSRNERQANNHEKAKLIALNNLPVADFGTRRRYSFENHYEVIGDLKTFAGKPLLVGTSNVYMAKAHGIKAIGTHAHEWFQYHAAAYGFKMSTEMALENWVKVYLGELGIALTDTITTDVFLKSFGKKYAKLFDGPRHDSNSPYVWGDKLTKHYMNLNIDPSTKTLVFTDGLDITTACAIKKYFDAGGANKQPIRSSYGIGTHLTNDVGVEPLNIVIKMMEAKPNDNFEWTPTIKLSDSPGKHTGDKNMIRLAKELLNIKEENTEVKNEISNITHL